MLVLATNSKHRNDVEMCTQGPDPTAHVPHAVLLGSDAVGAPDTDEVVGASDGARVDDAGLLHSSYPSRQWVVLGLYAVHRPGTDE